MNNSYGNFLIREKYLKARFIFNCKQYSFNIPTTKFSYFLHQISSQDLKKKLLKYISIYYVQKLYEKNLFFLKLNNI